MKLGLFLAFLCAETVRDVASFGVAPISGQRAFVAKAVFMSDDAAITFSSDEEKQKAVGNLVEDDEWNGLGMELTDAISIAISEDIKKNAREFLGKEDYNVGDISKEVDARVKDQLAKFRGKDDYELGDFTMAMDEMSKSMVEELTGKPYEVGDLSTEIDTRVKSAVAGF
jgi:hypothetical protein